jgi:thioesterase domain-containing protein
MLSSVKTSEDGVAQQKRLLVELLLQSNQTEIQTEVYPASLAQQRLWFLDQLGPKSAAYNVHFGLWLRGSLDMRALQSSLQELTNRHASLRTVFRLERGELVQVVANRLAVRLPITDLTRSANPDGEHYQLAKAEVEKSFDLSKGPLFRARVLRVTDTDHVFLCTMHHIVTDSWSVQIMAKELSALYGAFSTQRPSPLSELPITYGDYSEWQRKWFKTAKVQQQLNFWKDELEEAPPVLELRMQRPRSSEQTFEGASQEIPLGDEITSGIKALAVRLQATPFMLLLAAFKILLYRASGQPDLSVGVPVAGRNSVETEGLVGFFVNTLVLRDDLFFNPTFPDLVAQVRETTLRAFANADVPFEKVVEFLQPVRNLSYNPIFQVMFSVIKAAVQSDTFGDLTAFSYTVAPTKATLDLSMTIIEGKGGQFWAQIDYNTGLFRSEDVSRMLVDYCTLLQAVIGSPEKRIADLPIMDLPITDLPITEAAVDRTAECSLPLPSKTSSKRKALTLASTSHAPKPERPDEPIQVEQKLLVGIWRDLLHLPAVAIDDNFFEIGGHSLLAAQLIAQVQTATGRKIAVSAVFRAPTIRAFAQLLRDDLLAEPDPIAMKLHTGVHKEDDGNDAIPFFAVAAPGVDTFGFAQLARHLPPDQTTYKLQAPAPVVWGRPFTSDELQALARRYVAGMKSAQPHGPYCLGAMCEGVLIAQQMILQLEAEGEEVGLFTIFDTWVLENSQIRSLWAIDYYMQRFRNFRALSLDQQFETVRRIFKRVTAPGDTDSGSGWNRAYWPDKDFQPPRFWAPVLLFKRPRQPFFYVRDPQMGWGSRSRGGVETCEFKCGHYEMLREPHVRLIGQTIGNRLQAIRNQQKVHSALWELSGDPRDLFDSRTQAETAA